MPTLNELSSYEKFGGLDLPVFSADVDDTLNALDPAVHTLAELFKAAVNGELSEAWAKVTGNLPAAHPLFASSAVSDTLELEPTPQVMTQRKQAWPLLCVHRTGTATYEHHTMQLVKLTQPWALHYILGPLDIGDLHKLNKVCIAVAKIVDMVIRDRGHRNFESGATQFFEGTSAHFSAIELKSHEGPGQARLAEGGDSLIYYAITLNLETVETVKDKVEAYGDFAGTDYEVGVGDGEGIYPGLIYAASDVPLQIG